jgi:uncharacterized membrane protein
MGGCRTIRVAEWRDRIVSSCQAFSAMSNLSEGDDPGYPPHLAARRVLWSVAVGLVAFAATMAFVAWQAAVLIGWLAAVGPFLFTTWRMLLRQDARETARHATRLDNSRFVADGVLLAASTASLLAVGLLLLKGAQSGGAAEAAFTALSAASVVGSWAVVHTVFTLRYGHLYYGDAPGIDFNTDEEPTYRDFAYLAFTVGMTYQVSDTNITTRAIRSTALRHGLLSFVFGTIIIAMTINIVAGLVK